MEKSIKQKKKTMSVPEMGKLLGLKKTESYFLVHKGFFETILVGKNMRVMMDSFENWYSGQFHYKKIDGIPPGAKWTDTTMSIKETADLLGIQDWTLYKLIKAKPFKIKTISNKKRIDIESFENWYQHQTKYKKLNA